MNDDRDRLSFLGKSLPSSFEMRTVTIGPGLPRPYDEAEWRDALVVVERGEIEVECLGGFFRRFPSGAILWLVDLPVLAIHNRGRDPAVLVAVSRRRH